MAHGAKDARRAQRNNKKVQGEIFTYGFDGYTEKEQQRKQYAAAKKKSNAKKQRYYDDED